MESATTKARDSSLDKKDPVTTKTATAPASTKPYVSPFANKAKKP